MKNRRKKMKYKLKTIDRKHITLNDDFVVSVEYDGYHKIIKDVNGKPYHCFIVKTSRGNLDYYIALFDDYKMNEDDSNLKFVCDWGFNKD